MKIYETNVKNNYADHVELDKSLDVLREEIRSESLVIIRGMLSRNEVEHLRKFSRDFANSKPPSIPTVNRDTPNYHRIDENPPKSQVKSILHLHSFFYWNEESKPIINYFKRQFKIRNLLSNLREDYALDKVEDGFISVPAVQQFPRGGGYMQEHQDPDVGQKVVVDTILSGIPQDFQQGGLYCRGKDGNKLYIDKLVEPGDSIAFFPQIRHGVDPIDPDFQLDWNRDDGRWMCFSTLATLSSWQGIDDGTSGKAVTA